MDAADMDKFYTTVFKLVKEAGKLISSNIYRKKDVMVKSCEVDLVTQTDQDVENMLIKGLKANFPDHKFIGEESTGDGSSCNLTDSPTWIIDPIDGTMNFVHGFPQSCISIALFVNKEPQIGIIYNPMLDQMFTAKKGNGAFLNGEKISVSDTTDMSKALLMLECGTSRDVKKMDSIMENIKTLTPLVHGTRSLGSAALDMAMVAMGGADAYIEYGPHIWDFAAGELIVLEAGGVALDPSGGPLDRLSRRMLCACSATLAQQLATKITQYYPQPRD